ncbi:MAG: DUF3604 domain-containing protein [Patescibacteria group bacterium]|nr:DUF3604 domain-containing protein [Patescibacteria group bacterium]
MKRFILPLSLSLLALALLLCQTNDAKIIVTLNKEVNAAVNPGWSCSPESDPRDGAGSAIITKITTSRGTVDNPQTAEIFVGETATLKIDFTVGSQGIAPNGAILLFIPKDFSLTADLLKNNSSEVEISLTDRITNPSQSLNNYQCQETHSCIRTGEGFYNPGNLRAGLVRIGVPNEGLAPGRVIRINGNITNTFFYSPFILAQYENVKGVDQSYKFLIAVDGTGDSIGSFINQFPSLKVLPQTASYLEAVLPSKGVKDQSLKLIIKARDLYGNLAISYRGTVKITNSSSLPIDGLPASYTFTEADGGLKTFNLTPRASGTLTLAVQDSTGSVTAAESNPLKIEDNLSLKPYWGEFHVHSLQSDGVFSLYKLYDTAKRTVSLDFAAASDHSHWLTDSEWSTIKNVNSLFNQPGEFLTLTGYEMSFGVFTGGDINLYFENDNSPVFYPKNRHFYTADGVNPCENRGPQTTSALIGLNNAQELFTGQNLTKLTQSQAIAIPHHVSWASGGSTWQWPVEGTARLNYFNSELEKLVEIYSEQGSGEYFNNPLRHGQEAGQTSTVNLRDDRYFEPPISADIDPNFSNRFDCQFPSPGCLTPTNIFNVQTALAKGYRLGFTGGSDDHFYTFPGGTKKASKSANSASSQAICNSSLCYRGGLTAVYLPNLTKESLFSAFRQRHTYATTGERILLEFSAESNQKQYLLGDEIQASISPKFNINIVGTKRLINVEIVKGATGNYDPKSPFPVVYDAASKGKINDKKSEFTWEDPDFNRSAFYYLRVTQISSDPQNPGRPDMAWASPIWVDYIQPPTIAPPTCSIKINNSNSCTSDPNQLVNLQLNSQDASQMKIWNDGQTEGEWQNYNSQIDNWKINGWSNSKVWVRFKNAAGISDYCNATIIYPCSPAEPDSPSSCPCPSGVPNKLSGNADCNSSIDRADLNYWINQFVSGKILQGSSADFNCDGKVDRQDLGYWINGFAR